MVKWWNGEMVFGEAVMNTIEINNSWINRQSIPAWVNFRSRKANPNTLTIIAEKIPMIAQRKLKSWSKRVFVSEWNDSSFCSVLIIRSRSSKVNGISFTSAFSTKGKKNKKIKKISWMFSCWFGLNCLHLILLNHKSNTEKGKKFPQHGKITSTRSSYNRNRHLQP